MVQNELKIDLSFAKNALFVRQTIAVAFGIPLDREFTWPILSEKCYGSSTLAATNKIRIIGLAGLGIRVPDEARMLMIFLQDLKIISPKIDVMVAICD